MQIPPPTAGPPKSGHEKPDARDAAMRAAADALEATFLAEMLKSAGLGKPPEGFGGGTGEDQFSSFLVQEQAKQMVKAGGIGLSESIFQAMKARLHD